MRLPIFNVLSDPTRLFSARSIARINNAQPSFSNTNNYFLRSRRGIERLGGGAFFFFFVGAVINYYTGQGREKGRRGEEWVEKKRSGGRGEVNRNEK